MFFRKRHEFFFVLMIFGTFWGLGRQHIKKHNTNSFPYILKGYYIIMKKSGQPIKWE